MFLNRSKNLNAHDWTFSRRESVKGVVKCIVVSLVTALSLSTLKKGLGETVLLETHILRAVGGLQATRAHQTNQSTWPPLSSSVVIGAA